MYLKSDATKGLAEFRALQSRLDGAVDYVEAFGTEPHPEKPGITLEKRKSKPEPTHVIHG